MTDVIPGSLRARIAAATGIIVNDDDNEDLLAGMFNRYRPDGAGLQELLIREGLEKEVLARLMQIYAATSQGWKPASCYFIVEAPVAASRGEAVQLAENYLRDFSVFANHIGQEEVSEALTKVLVVAEPLVTTQYDDDLQTLMYECLTDFMVEQYDQNEIFLLNEAVYSIANDYFLAAYVFAPAFGLPQPASAVFDAYFELWRRGLKIEHYDGDIVAVVRAG